MLFVSHLICWCTRMKSMNANFHINRLMIEFVWVCVYVYLYIFVYHLYSWVRLSLSVRTIMISPSFFYCRQLDSHCSIEVLNFGLTRTLRTQDSTEANERHKRESETMVRESRWECVRASDEGAAKEELRESGLLRLGGK